MKGLWKYISPFAPDQSGAAAVMYGLNGIVVICDAGGCAGNICGFDEPRWFSGGKIQRGYYLSATPMERRERGNGVTMVSCVLGTGVKTLLLEANRYTDKQMGIACTLGASMAPEAITWCRREYGIGCEETTEYFPDAVKLPVPKKRVEKKNAS